MLNNNNERELAYLVRVEAITPMNADRLECAHIGGWHCVVGKGEFKVGDPAIYFEIDSQLPDVEPFSSMEFLKSKNFKIKSQKIRGEISQGLLMPVTAFGWKIEYGRFGWEPEGYAYLGKGEEPYAMDNENSAHTLEGETRFLTKKLGVTYADPGDNVRKGSAPDKYKKMSQRHPRIFKKKWVRWLMKHEWGRKLMFFFFGKKRDKESAWPAWVKRTDEERIENCLFYLNDKMPWIASEKLDGTSTTFTLKRGKWLHKNEFYICSRNVVFDKPDKRCFYDTNVYQEMELKYNIKAKMENMLDNHPEWKWITIQGETYGGGPLGNIQKNTYNLDEHKLGVFNFITSDKGRWNSLDMVKFLREYDIPCVPILNGEFILPDTIEELREYVHSAPSTINGKMKEGIVFRSQDGIHSFKCVDPEYLIYWH